MIKRKNISQNFHISICQKASSCLIHLGFAILACGILAVEGFTTHQEVCMEVGDQVQVGSLMITADAKKEEHPDVSAFKRTMIFSITGNGSNTRTIAPSLAYYAKQDLLYGQPAIHSTLLQDIYFIMNAWQTVPGGCAEISISLIPLITWIWIGGMVMAGGGLLQLICMKCE